MWMDSDEISDGALVATIKATRQMTAGNAKCTFFDSRTSVRSITDGTSQTTLFGEKHLLPDKMYIGTTGQPSHDDPGHGDGSIYNGDHDWHFLRLGGPGFGMAVTPTDTVNWSSKFGSAHSVVQFVFCDGSVRGLPRNIPPEILSRLIARNDGQSVPGDY
jgi:hypothetical protein